MAVDDLGDMLKEFDDGSGFGDPEARRNAELRLQVLLALKQCKTSAQLNRLTFSLVVVGFLNAMVLAFQVWGR